MLHILLMILKILLWIILGILGFVLLLVLLLLFAPIRYRVDAEYQGYAKVCARVRFLIVGVKVYFNQKDKAFIKEVRIAGIKLRTDRRNKNVSAKSHEHERDKEPEQVETDLFEPDTGAESDKTAESDKDVERDRAIGQSQEADDIEIKTKIKAEIETDADIDIETYKASDSSYMNEEFDLWDNEDEELPHGERKVFGRLKAFFKGIWDRLRKIIIGLRNFSPDRISERIDNKTRDIRSRLDKLKKFWNLSCTVKTRAYLKKYIIGIFRHIGPRKIKGHVRYGFGEPCKTGQITGYLSMLPFVYQKNFSLEPDFDNKVIDGNISLRGRVRLGYIIRIALNINLWRTVRHAMGIIR